MIIAALLGGVAIVAGFARSQVLDTNTYVQTVAPLARDKTVTDALAARLTDEIMKAANLNGLANSLADNLVKRGAPARLTDLVDPLVAQISSFVRSKLEDLLATPQFQRIWDEINRAGHQGIVRVLTGQTGGVINSSGTTVSIDLGALLTAAKPKLEAAGLGFVAKVPDVSIPYTIVESDKLPTIRSYVRVLDVVATWLPWVVLVLLLAGIVVAPNRRRGIITGAIMLGVVDLILLAALAVGRHIYLDSLPPTVQSPAAAEALYDAILRFLVDALETLLVPLGIIILAALIAGPARPARGLRRAGSRVLDAAGRGVSHAGAWTGTLGRAMSGVRYPLEIAIALLAVVLYILADKPTPGSVGWLTLIVLAVISLIEVIVRTARFVPAAPVSES